ncbi:sensor histidine kinase [Stakelama tenebrarum]|uniref:histidine kinase n=1 Tax=Stakelama tenebrarum TaxID=2711215 RepID=A0A6G6Y4T3_9SPHN|nr:HAMP domain-containing sensor histidine kinase [Sphingosinithalassobacter tenebrarum]QIG79925.1 hypothetical protein G5C33_09130 [Sphingosinithalassobacter tenebrarum]
MRFDDTLETVLAGDLTTPYGRHSAWRQLVDLIGRRRVPPDSRALATLNAIRNDVPTKIRAASARGLEYAEPPFALVSIFCVDEISVAAPVLRAARLSSSEWISLLPEMSSAARSVLRDRRDLGPPVKRALEAYGPADFILADGTPPAEALAMPDESAAPAAMFEDQADAADAEPIALPAESPAEPVMPAPWEQVGEAGELLPEETEVALRSLSPIGEAEEAGDADAGHETAAVATPEQAEGTSAVEASEPLPALSPMPDIALPGTAEPAEAEEVVAAESNGATPEDAAVAIAPVDTGKEPVEIVPVEREQLAPPDTHFEPLPAPSAIAAPVYPEEPAVPTESVAPRDAAAVAAEEDLSFVALAGFAASLALPERLAGAFGKPPSPESAEGVAHQSGTAATPPVPQPVASDAQPVEEVGMTEDLLIEEFTAEIAAEAAGQESTTGDDGAESDSAKGEGPFQISDVVARIDAFWRRQQEAPREAKPAPRPEGFRFETDAKGVIRWVDGVSRAPLVGLSLDLQGVPGAARIDAIAAGAFRRRQGFSNSRLVIDGDSDAAGDWLISAIPVFDPSSGRFSGYRGTARRPRRDERAEVVRSTSNPADSLRQLVHELRTPTNAIAGFAEMIETQILGPVSDPYRDRAGVIRTQAKELLGAIDDLDLAARIESQALALAPGKVALRPLLAGIADDLSPLADLRGACIALPVDDLSVTGDRRAVERLFARLMATLVSAAGEGERIGVRTAVDAEDKVAVTFERPAALADYQGDSVLGIDDEGSDATLLGTGFALRLARNLARELGGSLVIEADNLTLRLPAAENSIMGQAHNS